MHRLQRRKKLEELPVATAFAGKTDKGGDGETERVEIDLCAVASDES